VRYINSILQDKMLFTSDWPVITPDRWFSDFAKLEIRDEILPEGAEGECAEAAGNLARRVGKSQRSRKCAPASVPTIDVRWWARRESAFAHPTCFRAAGVG
jgi:hypothetical protein